MTLSVVRVLLIAIAAAVCACGSEASANRADAPVQQLGELPASFGPQIRSDGRPIPEEVARSEIYAQLHVLGGDGIRALGRGLHDADVRVRQNSALALFGLGMGYYVWGGIQLPKRDLSPVLSDIRSAIDDEDDRVKGLAIQAIFHMGAAGEPLVPILIERLESEEEMRATICFALRGIGPSAANALPALRSALSDENEQVRNQARLAIEAIETGE